MFIPREYQLIAVQSLYDYFAKNRVGNPVVAMPTGTGKAGVIAMFLKRAFMEYAGQRAIVATHVRELVVQNYEEFMGMWPTAPGGVYSAGAKRKDLHAKITFAGVQSLVKQIALFGKVDLFIIDECHLLSPEDESNYMRVINFLLQVNPHMKVIGLTATAWREGIGMITDGGTIFTDICIDMCDMVSFNWFLDQGYLSQLIVAPTKTQYDLTGVGMRGGDFKDLDLHLAVAKDQITFAALQEALAIATAQGRKKWLVFGAGLDHVAKIKEMLDYLGVSCRTVHSKMAGGERDKNIADHKAGEFVAMINNGILTTGYNCKDIDLILMLRPTASSKLWVQMLGRGTRPVYADGFDLTTQIGRLQAIQAGPKQNCLVLDFVGNTKRLGPINDPMIPRKKGDKGGEVPIKECECCGVFNHISARFCGGRSKHDPEFIVGSGCGEPFEFRVQIKEYASTEEVIKKPDDGMPVIETFSVFQTTYSLHKKEGKPDSVKVTYFTGGRKFPEWVLFDHPGFGRRKAAAWWALRSDKPCPASTAEALEMLENTDPPTHIKVWTNAPFPEIKDVCFMGEFAEVITTDEIPF